jgi:probable F420-dependent oxidoreductase
MMHDAAGRGGSGGQVLKLTMMLGSFDRLLGPSNMAHAIDVAKIVDEAGLYGVAIGEHVSLSSSLEGYPYEGGLRYGDAGRKPYLEPVALHGGFAAATTRVKLSNCVLLAPLRPAVLLAKQLATIDVLSRGRLQAVFGTGWSRDEYSSLNVDFSKRRQILRDNVAACRALWQEQPATFRSQTVSFEGLFSMPQPVQRRIPILLAAKAHESNATLVAELCDGWETGPDDSKSLDKLREGGAIYRKAFSAAGRDPGSFIVKSHLFPQWDDQGAVDWDKMFSTVPAMLEAGVTEFACAMPVGMKAPMTLDEIDAFMRRLSAKASQF